MAVAFVGVMRPDGSEEITPAFSQAGQLFQERMLGALLHEGIQVGAAFIQRPVPSFPADRRLWFRSTRGTVGGGIPASFLGFLNLGPLKTLTVGARLFLQLLVWTWRQRAAPGRVLLLYNVAAPPGLISIAAARLAGSTVVAVVADVQVPGAGLVDRSLLRQLEYWLQVLALRACDGLVVLTRRMVTDFAPRVRYMAMEGGVPDDPARGEGRLIPDEGTGMPVDEQRPLTVMYAGGLSELKGTPGLLGAMRHLPGEGIRLWITGDGPLRAAVEDAARRDHRIVYRGYCSYPEVLALMQRASVLINPHATRLRSARYVFPSKLLEYLATGRPVITTASTPEVREEYGDVCIVADDDSPTALAAAVESLAALPIPAREELGRRGRAHVLERKSWTVQGARIARFVQRCASGECVAE